MSRSAVFNGCTNACARQRRTICRSSWLCVICLTQWSKPSPVRCSLHIQSFNVGLIKAVLCRILAKFKTCMAEYFQHLNGSRITLTELCPKFRTSVLKNAPPQLAYLLQLVCLHLLLLCLNSNLLCLQLDISTSTRGNVRMPLVPCICLLHHACFNYCIHAYACGNSNMHCRGRAQHDVLSTNWQ